MKTELTAREKEKVLKKIATMGFSLPSDKYKNFKFAGTAPITLQSAIYEVNAPTTTVDIEVIIYSGNRKILNEVFYAFDSTVFSYMNYTLKSKNKYFTNTHEAVSKGLSCLEPEWAQTKSRVKGVYRLTRKTKMLYNYESPKKVVLEALEKVAPLDLIYNKKASYSDSDFYKVQPYKLEKNSFLAYTPMGIRRFLFERVRTLRKSIEPKLGPSFLFKVQVKPIATKEIYLKNRFDAVKVTLTVEKLESQEQLILK